jgi:hypothetical protein
LLKPQKLEDFNGHAMLSRCETIILLRKLTLLILDEYRRVGTPKLR